MHPTLLAAQLTPSLAASQRALADSQRRLHNSQLQLCAMLFPIAIAVIMAVLNLFGAFPQRLSQPARRALVIAAGAALGAIVLSLSLPDDSPLLAGSFGLISATFLLINSGLRKWTYIFDRNLTGWQREYAARAPRPRGRPSAARRC